MERDYGLEIDSIRMQLDEIREALMCFLNGSIIKQEPEHYQVIEPMRNMHPDKRLSEMMIELSAKADEDGETGAITYLGVFASGGRQSNWIRNEVSTDGLLHLIENNMAAKVLACIESGERLRLLLALLRGPKTVAQLVDQCGYSSSGQVYHHLKPLLAASLIKEEGERGMYVVIPHRVQGIIMVLAGISDMLDPKYTEGHWETEPND